MGEAGSDIDKLMTASCETVVTRPPMFLGLPRKLSALLIMLGVMAVGFVDDWTMAVAGVFVTAMVWAAVREEVAKDYWGFDNFLAWVTTDLRFLDSGGKDGWGGAKLCALPLSTKAPMGVERGTA
jgi:type IV secretory pathway VirB3-like protein